MSKTNDTMRTRRNLNPTPEARAAMWLWGKEYAAQGGGSMDFWDKLDASRQRLARDCADSIIDAAVAHGCANRRTR
jgi:hypothetical protein